MASDATLNLIVSLKDDASKGLDGIAGKSSFLGDALKFATGGAILGGITKISGAVTGFLGDAIQESRDAAHGLAQTEAVIKSTGGAAGVTATQIVDLAGSLSHTTLFTDDAIQAQQNLLLTFTNVQNKAGEGNDIFTQASKIGLDLATAMGTDAAGGAVQLGKALNDPVAGISALTRVGVTFTDQQKEQIKTMVAAGDTVGAQKIILGELSKEFGGSAAAAAQADGGFHLFQQSVADVKQQVGDALMPALTLLMGYLSGPGIAILQSVATALSTGLGTAIAWLTTTGIPMLLAGWNTIQPALATVGDFITSTLLPAFTTFAGFISANLMPILVGLGAMLTSGLVVVITGTVIPAFIAWATTAATAAATTIVALAPVLLPIAAIGVAAGLLYVAWNTNFLGIRDTLTTVWGVVQPVLATLETWLMTTLTAALQTLATFWTGTLLPAITAVWDFVQNSVFPLLGSLANVWIALVKLELTALAGLWQNVLLPALSAVWGYFNDNILPILASVASTLSTVLGPAVSAVVGFFNTWYTAIGGISGAISTVIGWLNSLASTLSSLKLPPWLTPGSPTPLEIGLLGIAAAADQAASSVGRIAQTAAAPGVSAPPGGSRDSGPLPVGITNDQLTQQQAMLATLKQTWVDVFKVIQDSTLLAMTATVEIMRVAFDRMTAMLKDLVDRINDAYNRAVALNGLNISGPRGLGGGGGGGGGPPGSPGNPGNYGFQSVNLHEGAIVINAAPNHDGHTLARQIYPTLRDLIDEDNRLRSVR